MPIVEGKCELSCLARRLVRTGRFPALLGGALTAGIHSAILFSR